MARPIWSHHDLKMFKASWHVTLDRRPNNVVLKSCMDWERIKTLTAQKLSDKNYINLSTGVHNTLTKEIKDYRSLGCIFYKTAFLKTTVRIYKASLCPMFKTKTLSRFLFFYRSRRGMSVLL